MLRAEEWAKHINPLIAFLAINHALVAREKCDALRGIKERKVYGHQFSLPDLPSWFSMYQSRKPVYAYKRLITRSSELTTIKKKLFSDFRKLNKAIKKNPAKFVKLTFTPQEIEASRKYWHDANAKLFEEIRDDIAETSLQPELEAKVRQALDKDELPMGFYQLVYTPCQLFYETSPGILYRKALERDVTAIENLLKLDPLILHDPAIGYQIQSVRLHGKASDYDRIFAAITKQPKINYKLISDERRSVKSDHGAQIYVMAKALNNPLEAPQIRELYNALAFDFEGTLADTDIRKPDSFDKSLRTKAAAQQKLLPQTEKHK